jgi:hypothetical protein
MKKDAPKENESDATNAQPAKELTNNNPDFKANQATTGTFPARKNTVTAEVLALLLMGENLTGMDAVFKCSTTRLAATVHYLEEKYNWTIDRVDMDVGTNDGRVTTVKVYYLSRATIRRAFDTGALQFCQAVEMARAKTRKQADKAKEQAHKRNVSRIAAKFDPSQGALFGGAAHA